MGLKTLLLQGLFSGREFSGPDPAHSNTGGIECGRHDVSSIRCKGGEYERGSPPLIWGSGGYPPGKNWEIVVPEKRF